MTETNKQIKYTSILFYFLAFVAITWFHIGMNPDSLTGNRLAELDVDQVKVAAIVCAVFNLITFAFEAYLGHCGMGTIKGTYKGRSHLKIAAFLGALSIIGTIASIYGMINNYSNWTDLLSNLIMVIFLFVYRSGCKKELEKKTFLVEVFFNGLIGSYRYRYCIFVIFCHDNSLICENYFVRI